MKNLLLAVTLLFATSCNRCHEEPPIPPRNEIGLFISPDGNDENPCTLGEPCKTISKTMTRLKPNDTLWVRGGEYDEGEIWIRNIATSENDWLVIMAYRNETPVFSNGVRHMIIDNDYVHVEGLSFIGPKFIAQVNGHTGAEIIGNTFTGAGWGFGVISVEGSDILIAKNKLDLNGSTVGSNGQGIYVHAGDNIKVSDNTVSGTSGYGIHVFDQRRTEDPPGFRRMITNVKIMGNTVSGSKERAGIIVAAQSPDAFADNILIAQNTVFNHPGNGITVTDQVSNVKIANNTVYNIDTDGIPSNGDAGIFIGKNAKEVYLYNNLIHLAENATAKHLWFDQAVVPLVTHGLYWPSPRRSNLNDDSPILRDPLFIDAVNADFRLQQHSPAIDAGIYTGLPYQGQAPDIGAHEKR